MKTDTFFLFLSTKSKELKTITTPKPVQYAITIIIVIAALSIGLTAFSLAPTTIQDEPIIIPLNNDSLILRVDFEQLDTIVTYSDDLGSAFPQLQPQLLNATKQFLYNATDLGYGFLTVNLSDDETQLFYGNEDIFGYFTLLTIHNGSFDNEILNHPSTIRYSYLTNIDPIPTFNNTNFLTGNNSAQLQQIYSQRLEYLAIDSLNVPYDITTLLAFNPSFYYTQVSSETLNVSSIIDYLAGENIISVQYAQHGTNESLRIVIYHQPTQQANEGVAFTCQLVPVLNQWNTIAFLYDRSNGATSAYLNNESCSGTITPYDAPPVYFDIGSFNGINGIVGQFDCFEIANNSLSPEKIGAWHTSVNSGNCPNASFFNEVMQEPIVVVNPNANTFSFMFGILALTLIIVLSIFVKKGMTQ